MHSPPALKGWRSLQRLLERAQYSHDQIERMLPNLRMYRATIAALRAGPNSDFYEGFYRNVMPLFTGEQRNALNGLCNPQQLPPRRV